MIASSYVGRVGGLAVALGIGAAAFSGSAVAWADATSAGSDNPSTGSSAAVRQGHDGSSAGSANRAARASNNNSGVKSLPAAAAARPRVTAPRVSAPAATSAATDLSQPNNSPAPVAAVRQAAVAQQPASRTIAAVAPTVPVAAVAAPVAAAVSSVIDPLADPLANGSPAGPVESPLVWSLMEYARRTPQARPAAATASAVAAASTYSIGACSQSSTACAYVMGPSGVPIPTTKYVQNVMDMYVVPNYPDTEYTVQTVFTPEGAYPVTGIKVLPLTISAQQGQTILEDTMGTLQPGFGETEVPITIFGFSQSAVISSLLQRDLTSDPTLLPGVNRDKINFVTVGQEMSPDGGWFARYPGLNVSPLGEYFFGSTPEDDYPTTNYTLEYDGFADSPRYPLNFLSDLNAAMGILLVHINYGNPNYFLNTYGPTDTLGTLGPGTACGDGSSSNCIELPTTSDTQKYYFMQTPNLPLLAPLRAIPIIGNPLADLIQPVLKVIVNLGYGDPAHGFTTGTQAMANVPAPFGLFPDVNPLEVIQQLVEGVGQGISDFIADLSPGGSLTQEVSAIGNSLFNPSSSTAASSSGNVITDLQNAITNVGTRIAAGASALYASLLSTADFVNSAVVTVPTYSAVLFLDGVQQMMAGDVIGGAINAVLKPVAAAVGLAGYIAVLQGAVWLEAILAAITGCGPAAPTTGLCTIPALA